MGNIADIHADEIKRLCDEIDNLEIQSKDDARLFITTLTKLVYDYKMIGKIYDFYAEDVEYHKQNKTVFTNIEDVVRSVANLCAAFPNLKTSMEHIIVQKESDDFYKLSKRLRYHGNNYGPSIYGPPTGKSLANNCLSMSMIYLKRIGGKWKITFEINNDSEAWLEEVQTMSPPPMRTEPCEPARECPSCAEQAGGTVC